MGNAWRAALGLCALALLLFTLLPSGERPSSVPKAAAEDPADPPRAPHPAKATSPWPARPGPRPVQDEVRLALDEVDPRHPDYDPVVARNRLDASMQEIVAREPRDPAWAEAREALILEQLAMDLDTVPGFPSVQGIECRSHSCRVEVAIDTAAVDQVLGLHPVMMSSPTSGVRTASEDADGRAFLEFYLLFPGPLKDQAQYRAWYQERRKRVLDQVPP